MLVVLVAGLAGCASDGSEGSALSITVSGNQFVDTDGNSVVLQGATKAGSEYACIQGWGSFDGPVGQGSIDAMRQWNFNTVRIPLNSACWLDLPEQFTKYDPRYAGEAYRDAIVEYVDLVNANGMYAVLDLHWSGCSAADCLADGLTPMPGRPDAARFWESVASTFKDNRAVLFELFNEPHDVDWTCWRDGGCTVSAGDDGAEYVAAGMQEMVDAVRAAGADSQPILVGGLQFSNDATGLVDYMPDDPGSALAASIHLYNFNSPCPTAVGGQQTAEAAIQCFNDPALNQLEPIAATHPVVFTELGQSGCGTEFVAPMLQWIRDNSYSSLGWAWNPYDCSEFPAMIADYDGTPTQFGQAFKDAYR